MAKFLHPELADAYGLVALGGDLTPGRILQAYRNGIFPWYDAEDPVCWWSPDPRAIFELESFHVSCRLGRTLASGRFTCTIDRAFTDVIHGCADREEGTWLHPEMIEVYEALHRLGYAHSVEAWQDDQLAGGVYGVALAGFFAGESMFTRRRDGSKVALSFLVEHLKHRGFTLFDIQMLTPHTVSLGAVEIPRQTYLRRLRRALASPATFLDTETIAP